MTGSRSQRPESISICHATAQAEEPKQKINSKEEDGPGGVKRFTITVPAAAVGKAWQKAIKMESRSHDFPGFRQGKKVMLLLDNFKLLSTSYVWTQLLKKFALSLVRDSQ